MVQDHLDDLYSLGGAGRLRLLNVGLQQQNKSVINLPLARQGVDGGAHGGGISRGQDGLDGVHGGGHAVIHGG
ncbi:unnamed protein product [Chondrus crispus]|uniref:Uncharacterized protein n=1 Tax=Chondrus crispus TaxID=2769 RepID=R7QA00_CHOCR|nr:unnamed protein product [Chondrus crispus]CDF34236.1 unnamed protein product [Chondrus crispus]|eukprot:XP_005714055.1 unnamed protein product [Chondrus crispus]